jgi:hypothetical protein
MSRQIHYYAVNIEQNVFHIQIKIKNNFLKYVLFYFKRIFCGIKCFLDLKSRGLKTIKKCL